MFNDRIKADASICGGEACIEGTRIPVHVILSHIAAGESYDKILNNFPRLKMKDIQICLEYASYLATEKSVI